MEFSIRRLRRDEVEVLLDHLERVAEERRWIAAEPPVPRAAEPGRQRSA